MHLIYCITNLVNGKQYVGKTSRSVARRWWWHKYCAGHGSCCAVHLAIVKYGVDSFSIESIDCASSEKELCEKEVFHIARLNTRAPSGYNLTLGGEGATGWTPSEECRQKISRANFGRVRTKEANEKAAETLRNRPPREFCRRGHPLVAENIRVRPDNGARYCLTCFYLTGKYRLPKKLLQFARS
jgi:group I intron endonuclease